MRVIEVSGEVSIEALQAEIERLKGDALVMGCHIRLLERDLKRARQAFGLSGPAPTARGIEYAARRLWRIGTRTCPRREPAKAWSEVDAGRRAGWRAIAIAVWCHPQTSKTLR